MNPPATLSCLIGRSGLLAIRAQLLLNQTFNQTAGSASDLHECQQPTQIARSGGWQIHSDAKLKLQLLSTLLYLHARSTVKGPGKVSWQVKKMTKVSKGDGIAVHQDDAIQVHPVEYSELAPIFTEPAHPVHVVLCLVC